MNNNPLNLKNKRVVARKSHRLEPKPFLPPVSIEQFLAVEPGKPETFTGNELVDVVAVGFFTLKPLNGKRLAEYLRVDQKKLSGALEILTGYSFTSLRYRWVKHNLEKLQKMEPKLAVSEIAFRLGFPSSSCLWATLKTEAYRVQKRTNVRKPGDSFEKWYSGKI